ncbi:MAG: hypothetical protein WKF31_01345 [Thermoleophilaceae bacterium]
MATQVVYPYLPDRWRVRATRGVVGLMLAASDRRGRRGARRRPGHRARG